jgi:hypothetical protein
MNTIVNKVTSIFGLLLIPFAGYAFYTLEKMSGWDFLLIILAAGFLMYLKNNRAASVIENIFINKNLKK